MSDDTPLLKGATLSITIDGVTVGHAPKLAKATPRSHDGTVEPHVRQKAAAVRDRYHELRLEMERSYAVTFRAYDEGVAYRFETALPGQSVTVTAEEASFNFTGNHIVYYPEEESFFSHNERHFLPRALGDLAPKNIASLPAVVDANGIKVAIAESDVEGYPGLWLRGTSGNGLSAVFPPYPLEEKLERDRDLRVVKTADYIARTSGTRSYPWRILGVARSDAELITNPLVYLLAKPSQVSDTSWIKPGKVAWDWWNANNISGVDFKAGINTATYKHYIDFASKHGIEYVILDEGWYRLGNVLDVVPEIDMNELTTYAKQRNVGLILWVIWKTFEDQLQPALDRFERWGIRGIKVDFMQRDDQPVVDFYHRVSREAAKRRMLVDFHGAIRPALMTRTWPNLMTVEGVRGLEWCKWSAHTHPEHDATLPFTRMFLGPMDYTPGAMVNAPKQSFVDVFERPMSQGTRAHQLALYVIFESPLQMLADSPSNYAREPEAMEWLARVPVVWDETRVLHARIGDFVVVARRSGSDWYIGAITDWEPRELEIDLSFLPAGSFQMDAWQDGVNANRRGEDCRKVTSRVTSATKLKIALAEGGGWAARIFK
jgi:alpha-glucosidase